MLLERLQSSRWANAMLVSGLFAIISLLLSLAGPFGTFRSGEFDERLIYWTVLIYVSLAIALGFKVIVRNLFSDLSDGLHESLVVVGTTILFTPFLWYWTSTMFPGMEGTPPKT